MPISDYDCDHCGIRFEEIFLSGQGLPDEWECPRCERAASRVKANRFSVVGPVYSDMEQYESALIKSTDRARGIRFRSAKDIAKWEQKNGLSRVDPNSVSARASHDAAMEEVTTRDKIVKEDGAAAEADWIAKQEICEAANMDNMQYSRWKSAADVAEKAAKDGKVNVDAPTSSNA